MDSVIQTPDSNSGDVRERRKWKTLLALGVVLTMGPTFGLIGTFIGMWYSFDRIQTLKAPTPGDLAAGVNLSLAATTLGLLAGAAGATLVVLSCVKLAKFWNSEPTPANRAS